jgi:predicted GTPase
VKFLKTWWLLLWALLSLPYVVLFTVGSLWLYEHGWLMAWLVGSGVLMLASRPLINWLRAKRIAPVASSVEPSPLWPPSGQGAWADVERIAQRVQAEDLPLDRPEPLWKILREVLEAVAAHYHPKSDHAVLETPMPHVLRIIELVARDLREALSENVPGAHILTLNDMRRISRWTANSRPLYFLYRVVYAGFNPMSALLREMRDLAGRSAANASIKEVKRWAVGYCVRKAGYYAIQLYSGHLVLDDAELQTYQTTQSREAARRANEQETALSQEPLRILVLGQVKAGKSSLINALFGEMRAAVDVLPTTRDVDPYVLERDGIRRAIIFDTAGYQDARRAGDALKELRQEILQCDLVLQVCSAQSAARDADRRLLDDVRTYFQQDPHRVMPPLVIALTHVDQLRPFAEWNPPYDLEHPSGAKAQQIRDAALTVASDLQVELEQVVPVSLKPEQIYNIEEGLLPVILQALPDAQRVKCLRCLRQYHDEQYWRRLWHQAQNSGRLLWQSRFGPAEKR